MVTSCASQIREDSVDVSSIDFIRHEICSTKVGPRIGSDRIDSNNKQPVSQQHSSPERTNDDAAADDGKFDRIAAPIVVVI